LWWDLRQVIALHRWRQSHKGGTDDWFEVLGQFEYLNSYANLAFNQPHWTFPEWSPHWHEFKAFDLGHPLIPAKKAVTNDFILKDPRRIALITGSNMAGKSTFLRTLGSTVLIAMAGGPVFATSCTLCPCFILSSMRISDNLQEETSTFYAELKKIKIILESVTAGRHVLVLIDEMLRGTNTLDREKGSRAFIRQLIRYGAVAVIASHDTGLAGIREDFPGVIDNYYFDSVVTGEELHFDYRIKPGVCTQTNASHLMKKMGIELKED
jgi:DNA mismatch repair ATPase MutS